MMRTGRAGLPRFPLRSLHRRGEQILHKAASMDISLLVIRNLFEHGWSETHREPAVNLAFDDHRVDDVAAIVHRHKAPDLDLPSPLIDVDDTDVTPKGKGQVGRIIVIY